MQKESIIPDTLKQSLAANPNLTQNPGYIDIS